jgi:hypothetical protein
LLDGDEGKLLESNSSSNLTLTIPLHTSEPIPVGSQILIFRFGSGELTIAPTAGVTLYSANGTRLGSRYSVASLIKRFNDIWVLAGDTKI